MEKILLIKPAQTYYRKTYRESAAGSIGLPLGLLYIAAVLERKGCLVKVIDSLFSDQTVTKRQRSRIDRGIPLETLAEEIRQFQPDIVGIGSQYTAQEENVLNTAKMVKDIDESVLVIVGGANVSCRAEDLMKSGKIDIAVYSEGEIVVKEIVDFYRGRRDLGEIKGIFYRHGDEILRTEEQSFIENLDEIFPPAYHLVNMEEYLTLYKKGIYSRDRDVRRNVSMITSRGCPYSCVFCSISHSMGKAWRAHSADYVIRHIRMLSETFDVRHIHFEDDNLLFDPSRFLRILEVLKRKEITWDTPNGIRVNLEIDEIMLKEMLRSGCKSLTIGVECGDEYVLNHVVRKGIKLADVEEFARRCQEIGLPLRAFFVLGFPGETRETMKKTIDFALHLLEEYDVEIMNLIATPLFGTELYDICDKQHYFSRKITARALSESTVSDGYGLISTESFSSTDVEQLSRSFTARVYRRLFLKGLAHPFRSYRRIGNTYILRRTLKRIVGLR